MRGGEGGREGCLLHCFFLCASSFIPVENDCKKQGHQNGKLSLSFQTSEMLTLGARSLAGFTLEATSSA